MPVKKGGGVRGRESLGFGNSLIDEEALERGKEFLSRVEGRLRELTERVEGQPSVERIDMRFKADKNETLLFVNNGMIFKQLVGVDVEGRAKTIGENEMMAEKVVIPVDNIDVEAYGESEELKAYLAATPTNIDPDEFSSYIAVYERYRVDNLLEHDIAVIPNEDS